MLAFKEGNRVQSCHVFPVLFRHVYFVCICLPRCLWGVQVPPPPKYCPAHDIATLLASNTKGPDRNVPQKAGRQKKRDGGGARNEHLHLGTMTTMSLE